ncbi:glycoside hydrolase family 16 protein [Chelatococcus sp. GCM10030263]|uniref:glycoside hydrolase family 16 protein n=1 Tax=Chelatococcus sp. GCM10030263 TaxID=3273387 RepID=UPI0036177675
MIVSRRSLLGAVLVPALPRLAWAQDEATIDLSRYELVFDEPFDTLDVSAWGPGTRWIAHTPWNGDFGDARFADPVEGFPFTTENGVLRIEARKGTDGKWRSGLLASVDRNGNGFSQRYGYFETRAKLPPGLGLWSAFWLIGRTNPGYTAEVDIVEHYGQFPERFTSSVHVWNRVDKTKSRSVYSRIPVPSGSLYDDFHTYGASVDPQWIRIFLDRKEVWRTPTPPEFDVPLYPIVNLNLGAGWPIDQAPSPSFMYVDYVRAWKPKA